MSDCSLIDERFSHKESPQVDKHNLQLRAKKMRLSRTVQCAKCPWKVSSSPFDIPNGYEVEKHRNLACTIADSDSPIVAGTVYVMQCHESSSVNPEHCVGWLHNQLGIGNNIALRIKMFNYANLRDIRVIGEQHQSFEDTLPS